MFLLLLQSICERFFLRACERKYPPRRKRERERKKSARGRKQRGLTRVFAQHSETHFDLPLSCIGFCSSAWKGRTPLNQHHLLWLCIRIRSPRITPSRSSSSPLAPSLAFLLPCSSTGRGGEAEEPWQQWARSKVGFLI